MLFRSIFLLVAFFVQAGPLWMRYPKISPDGKQIAFSYKGDIYVVSTEGGEARQLTTHPAYESYPVWSQDGKQIAFTSDRNGNFDIFVMSSRGGDARQVTTNSAREIPYTFTPDGKEIVYGAQMSDPAQSALFPAGSMTELYAISVNGGRPRQILATPAEEICFFKSGDAFLYQDKKGGENEWRKHHTSSITRDIYHYDMKSGKHTRLIDRAGEDRSPVLSPDEQRVYFLSEREGSFNVYSFPVADPSAVKAETSFKTHPVRFLSIAGNGRLCFGYDGEIYVKDVQGTPKKVKVDIIGDNAKDNIASLRFTSGATSATVSSDGKQVAMIIRGNVFVTSTDYTTTKQITATPEGEKWLSFAPDNRTIAYASERGGNWNIYTAKIAREEEVNFPSATLIEEEAVLPSSTKERFAPQFSPDGKELAFIEDRTKLMVVDLKTKKVRQVADDKYQYRTGDGFTYTWSPDGKWFAMEIIGNRHDPYSDIAIVSADGKGEVINLTNSGYFDSNPRWVLDGNAILFSSERYGMRNHASWGSLQDVMIVFMNQDAYDKFRLNKEDYELLKEEEKRIASLKNKEQKEDQKDKKGEAKPAVKNKNIEVELQGIEDRVMRLTPNSSQLGDAILSKSGDKLYYMASFEGGLDLWVSDLRSRSTKVMHKLNSGWALLDIPGVAGLGEVMDFNAVAAGDERMLSVIEAAANHGVFLDGHVSALTGRRLQTFRAMGIDSDHTVPSAEKLREELALGFTVQVQECMLNREIVQAMNDAPVQDRICLVTDDVPLPRLMRQGHLNFVVERAIELGLDPIRSAAPMPSPTMQTTRPSLTRPSARAAAAASVPATLTPSIPSATAPMRCWTAKWPSTRLPYAQAVPASIFLWCRTSAPTATATARTMHPSCRISASLRPLTRWRWIRPARTPA